MAIAFVNATGTNASAGSTTIASPAFNLTGGNTVIVCVTNYTTPAKTVSSIADTAGNTYSRAGSVEQPNADDGRMEVWYATNCTGNASNVVTVTFSGSAEFRVLIVGQYSGLATSSVYDVAASGRMTNSTEHTTNTTATTTQADELIVGFFIPWDTGQVYSASAPYTVRRDQGSGNGCLADRIVSATGTYSITVGVPIANNQGSLARTFKMDTGGGGSPTWGPLLGLFNNRLVQGL